MNFTFNDGGVAAGGVTLTIGIWIFSIIIHIAFCIGVHRDAKRIQTIFVGPGIWAFATLLGGVYTAVAYWIVHHSSLVVKTDSVSEKDSLARMNQTI